MKLNEIISRISFKAVGQELGLDVRMVDGQLCITKHHPRPVDDRPFWAQRLSSKSCFCRFVVQSGLLSQRQMVHAALRYRLGRSKDDAVIYWQIDQQGRTRDGKLMWYGSDCHRLKHHNATWVSYLLKKHYGMPQDSFQPVHCFFGLHRIDNNHRETITVVEAEKSAVILSELYPQYIWLAAGGMNELKVEKFFPLRFHKVILFPDTDPDQRAYDTWYAVAQQVMKSFFWPRGNPIRVSPILELHATEDQKRRKIDLVDYIFERQIQPEFSVKTP